MTYPPAPLRHGLDYEAGDRVTVRVGRSVVSDVVSAVISPDRS